MIMFSPSLSLSYWYAIFLLLTNERLKMQMLIYLSIGMIYWKRTGLMGPYECILLGKKKKERLLSRFEFCFESLKIRSTCPGVPYGGSWDKKAFYFSPTPVIWTWPLEMTSGNSALQQWQQQTGDRQSRTSDLLLLMVAYSEEQTISFRAGGRNQVEYHEFTTWGFMRSDSKEDKGHSHCRQEGSASHYDKKTNCHHLKCNFIS